MNDPLRHIENGGLGSILGGEGGDGFLVTGEEKRPAKPADFSGIGAEKRAESKRRSYCQACKRAGNQQVAHRVLANGDGICSPHFHGELVEPPKAKAEPAKPPQQVPAATPAAEKKESSVMQQDQLNQVLKLARAGVPPRKIAEQVGGLTKYQARVAIQAAGLEVGSCECGRSYMHPSKCLIGAATVRHPELKGRNCTSCHEVPIRSDNASGLCKACKAKARSSGGAAAVKPHKSVRAVRAAVASPAQAAAELAHVKVSETFLDNLWARLELDEKVSALQPHLEA